MKHRNSFVTEVEDAKVYSIIEVDDTVLSAETRKKDIKPDPNHGQKETLHRATFESDNETVLELLRFVYSMLDPNRESTVSETFTGTTVLEWSPPYSNEVNEEERREHLEVLVDRDGVFIGELGTPAIYFNKSGISPDESERDLSNFSSFESFLSEVLSGAEIRLDEDIEGRLENMEYGENVRRYLRDGDTCRAMGMNTQAILSYILAAEWAGITYLKSERQIDLIEEQRENDTWYSFSGEDSVVEKVSEQFRLDQTSKDMFDTIYRQLRNISAHHTTGEILDQEVTTMKQRVVDFITELDSQRAE